MPHNKSEIVEPASGDRRHVRRPGVRRLDLVEDPGGARGQELHRRAQGPAQGLGRRGETGRRPDQRRR